MFANKLKEKYREQKPEKFEFNGILWFDKKSVLMEFDEDHQPPLSLRTKWRVDSFWML